MDGHCLLAGSNSAGKSTICEALDLVMGPERMLRRPVIDEYDFYRAQYQERGGELPEVRIDVVLTDLSDAAQRRFGSHLRRWSRETNDFLDLVPDAIEDAEAGEWSLPVSFIGCYDPQEDDFAGGTFFAHPEAPADDPAAEDTAAPGAGLRPFTRADKRHCGFLYLRPNRTGNRALTFQRGSLLDTIVRLEAELADLFGKPPCAASTMLLSRLRAPASTRSGPRSVTASAGSSASVTPPTPWTCTFRRSPGSTCGKSCACLSLRNPAPTRCRSRDSAQAP
nr:hypothetical protein [Streptomyces sp. SID3343]